MAFVFLMAKNTLLLKHTTMKKLKSILVVVLLIAANSLFAQKKPNEYLGLPGDNLNLYAVMDIFQNSETIEAFERSLNDPDKTINNLDLNDNKLVDYIMVYDYVEGNVHTIVLRVALNQTEQQDVAVFTVQQFNDGTVQIQLIGDEALYGPNYIIEPIYAETANPGYSGNAYQAQASTVVTTTYYEVASWPVIVYLYEPAYTPWSSAWYWDFYPSYWHPWAPHYWHFYYGYHSHWHSHYYAYYRPWRYYRCNRYRDVYLVNTRNYSRTVTNNVNSGQYKETYSKPERVRDGENLFAQKYPNGVPKPNRERIDNNRVEQDRPNLNQGVNNNESRPIREQERDANKNPTRQNMGSAKPKEVQSGVREDMGSSAGKERPKEILNRPPQRENIAKQPQRPSQNESARPAKQPQRPSQNTVKPPRQQQKPVRSESPKPKVEKQSKPVQKTQQSESKKEKTGNSEKTVKGRRSF